MADTPSVRLCTEVELRQLRADLVAGLPYGDEDRFRERAENWMLDVEEEIIFVELERIDFLLGD